ncbi:MAG: UDP-N-acetylmuramoyl-L-alanine--D-glutamate ligase [Campylobacterota bacterium]|nr:UDP-N-acetylmuramoyl-L-alanine--D-glutamate ligase [Campylobacterota bacterium]
MRILGKGKTAQAIKEIYKDAVLFDDNDKDIYDINSDELTVVSPGIPPHNSLVKNTKNKISDCDLFLEDDMFTVCISGTNGKTTTTSMIYHLLKDYGFSCGGNIGTPLAQIKDEKKLILEISSFTLHYTSKAKPNIYILLPISPDHLSWHGSFEEYEKSKLKPLSMMSKNDTAIIPVKYKDYKTDTNMIYYESTNDLAKIFNIDINNIIFKEPFLLDSVLALSVYKIVVDKLDYDKINSFIQDPHKLEEFYDSKNRLWVDDSKATNIDATIQALKAYKDKKIFLILGGDDKGVDLKPLFEELKMYNVEIYAIGTNTKKLKLLSDEYDLPCIENYKLNKAVNYIIQNSKFKTQNCVALLSPAASSLDQYNSYKHRGEEFKRVIKDININLKIC